MSYYNIAPDKNMSESDLLKTLFMAARDRGTGDTGIFGLRMQWHSFNFFLKKLHMLFPACSSDHERIQGVFGRTLFVHLVRQNKLDQAISYVKATQTGLWHKTPDGVELERRSPPQDPVYDAESIQRHLTELTDMDGGWCSWFAKEKIDTLRINYDDLSADPIDVTGGLLEHLGLDRGLSIGLVLPVAKLADRTSKRWAHRFLADKNTRS